MWSRVQLTIHKKLYVALKSPWEGLLIAMSFCYKLRSSRVKIYFALAFSSLTTARGCIMIVEWLTKLVLILELIIYFSYETRYSEKGPNFSCGHVAKTFRNQKTSVQKIAGLSFLKNIFIYLFIFDCAESLLLHELFSGCVHRLLVAVACHVSELAGFSSCGSWDLEHRLNSCVVWACGILPDQGSNPCLLHWQVKFFTTEPPGKPQASVLTSAKLGF